jgi:hypothetical protein
MSGTSPSNVVPHHRKRETSTSWFHKMQGCAISNYQDRRFCSVKSLMRCVHVQRSSNIVILRGRDGIVKSGTCIQRFRKNVYLYLQRRTEMLVPTDQTTHCHCQESHCMILTSLETSISYSQEQKYDAACKLIYASVLRGVPI